MGRGSTQGILEGREQSQEGQRHTRVLKSSDRAGEGGAAPPARHALGPHASAPRSGSGARPAVGALTWGRRGAAPGTVRELG